MKSFETELTRNDGTDLYVQGWEPENGRAKGLVALVHGLGEHSGRYQHVGEAFAKAGYTLVGFDLRGHGRSGGVRGHTASLETLLQDIKQFLTYLVYRYTDLPHFIYGHSLGGLLTLTYTLKYGAGLQGVVVTGVALRSPLQQQTAKVALVKTLGSFFPKTVVPSGLDANTISRDPEVVKVYQQDPFVHDKISLGLGKATLDAIRICFQQADEFKPPLLMIHGASDQLTFPSGSEEFAKRASKHNSDVTLRLWENLYHEVHNEPEKQEVLDYIVGWLDRHL